MDFKWLALLSFVVYRNLLLTGIQCPVVKSALSQRPYTGDLSFPDDRPCLLGSNDKVIYTLQLVLPQFSTILSSWFTILQSSSISMSPISMYFMSLTLRRCFLLYWLLLMQITHTN